MEGRDRANKRAYQDNNEAGGAGKRGTCCQRDFPVMDALPHGKENAVSAQQLCNVLHFESVRELQKEIARERKAGAVILSTCQKSGGYFLPADEPEVRRFIRTLENRANNTLAVLHSARELLGQQEDGE